LLLLLVVTAAALERSAYGQVHGRRQAAGRERIYVITIDLRPKAGGRRAAGWVQGAMQIQPNFCSKTQPLDDLQQEDGVQLTRTALVLCSSNQKVVRGPMASNPIVDSPHTHTSACCASPPPPPPPPQPPTIANINLVRNLRLHVSARLYPVSPPLHKWLQAVAPDNIPHSLPRRPHRLLKPHPGSLRCRVRVTNTASKASSSAERSSVASPFSPTSCEAATL
jgi:hypothetical protein